MDEDPTEEHSQPSISEEIDAENENKEMSVSCDLQRDKDEAKEEGASYDAETEDDDVITVNPVIDESLQVVLEVDEGPDPTASQDESSEAVKVLFLPEEHGSAATVVTSRNIVLMRAALGCPSVHHYNSILNSVLITGEVLDNESLLCLGYQVWHPDGRDMTGFIPILPPAQLCQQVRKELLKQKNKRHAFLPINDLEYIINKKGHVEMRSVKHYTLQCLKEKKALEKIAEVIKSVKCVIFLNEKLRKTVMKKLMKIPNVYVAKDYSPTRLLKHRVGVVSLELICSSMEDLKDHPVKLVISINNTNHQLSLDRPEHLVRMMGHCFRQLCTLYNIHPEEKMEFVDLKYLQCSASNYSLKISRLSMSDLKMFAGSNSPQSSKGKIVTKKVIKTNSNSDEKLSETGLDDSNENDDTIALDGTDDSSDKSELDQNDAVNSSNVTPEKPICKVAVSTKDSSRTIKITSSKKILSTSKVRSENESPSKDEALKMTPKRTIDSPTKSPDKHNSPTVSPDKHNRLTKSPDKHNRPTRSPNKDNRLTKSPDKHISPTRSPDKLDSPTRSSDKHNSPTRSHDRHISPTRSPDKHNSNTQIQCNKNNIDSSCSEKEIQSEQTRVKVKLNVESTLLVDSPEIESTDTSLKEIMKTTDASISEGLIEEELLKNNTQRTDQSDEEVFSLFSCIASYCFLGEDPELESVKFKDLLFVSVECNAYTFQSLSFASMYTHTIIRSLKTSNTIYREALDINGKFFSTKVQLLKEEDPLLVLLEELDKCNCVVFPSMHSIISLLLYLEGSTKLFDKFSLKLSSRKITHLQALVNQRSGTHKKLIQIVNNLFTKDRTSMTAVTVQRYFVIIVKNLNLTYSDVIKDSKRILKSALKFELEPKIEKKEPSVSNELHTILVGCIRFEATSWATRIPMLPDRCITVHANFCKTVSKERKAGKLTLMNIGLCFCSKEDGLIYNAFLPVLPSSAAAAKALGYKKMSNIYYYAGFLCLPLHHVLKEFMSILKNHFEIMFVVNQPVLKQLLDVIGNERSVLSNPDVILTKSFQSLSSLSRGHSMKALKKLLESQMMLSNQVAIKLAYAVSDIIQLKADNQEFVLCVHPVGSLKAENKDMMAKEEQDEYLLMKIPKVPQDNRYNADAMKSTQGSSALEDGPSPDLIKMPTEAEIMRKIAEKYRRTEPLSERLRATMQKGKAEDAAEKLQSHVDLSSTPVHGIDIREEELLFRDTQLSNSDAFNRCNPVNARVIKDLEETTNENVIAKVVRDVRELRRSDRKRKKAARNVLYKRKQRRGEERPEDHPYSRPVGHKRGKSELNFDDVLDMSGVEEDDICDPGEDQEKHDWDFEQENFTMVEYQDSEADSGLNVRVDGGIDLFGTGEADDPLGDGVKDTKELDAPIAEVKNEKTDAPVVSHIENAINNPDQGDVKEDIKAPAGDVIGEALGDDIEEEVDIPVEDSIKAEVDVPFVDGVEEINALREDDDVDEELNALRRDGVDKDISALHGDGIVDEELDALLKDGIDAEIDETVNLVVKKAVELDRKLGENGGRLSMYDDILDEYMSDSVIE